MKRVLFIEDDVSYCEILAEVLGKNGYIVDGIASPIAALDIYVDKYLVKEPRINIKYQKNHLTLLSG